MQLKLQGKSPWPYKVNAFPPLADDAGDDARIAAGKTIAAALRAHLPKGWFSLERDDFDDDYDNILWELDHIGWEGANVREHLRDVVEALYDWADIKRVWLANMKETTMPIENYGGTPGDEDPNPGPGDSEPTGE
jgi:hypothetical protein